MLISPAEPARLKSIGTSSSTPEDYGADFLFYIPDFGKVGIQRKEVGDLINSVFDGRLGKELSQMKRLDQGLFIIEGRLQWTNDGFLLGRQGFTQNQYRGLMLRIALENYWTLYTDDLEDTLELLLFLEKWWREVNVKGSYSSLNRKQKVTDEWGRSSSKEWSMGVLMHFGMGAKMAARFYDQFGLPLEWTIEEEEMTILPGVGKARAAKIYGSLNGRDKEKD